MYRNYILLDKTYNTEDGRVGIIFLKKFQMLSIFAYCKKINWFKTKIVIQFLLCSDYGNSIPKVESCSKKEAK